MYNKSALLWLYEHGYRQKLICMIMGYNQSFVSKNCNNPRNYIPTFDTANDSQMKRKIVVDRILECRHLRKFDSIRFDEQDKAYIKILDYCLVDRDAIRKLYATISQYKISQAYRENKSIIKQFDPAGLEIAPEDWQLFLHAIFKEDEI